MMRGISRTSLLCTALAVTASLIALAVHRRQVAREHQAQAARQNLRHVEAALPLYWDNYDRYIATSAPGVWVRIEDHKLVGADRRVLKSLKGVRLRGAELPGVDLRAMELERVDLSDAHMTGSRLDKATLKECNLAGAQLQRARLYDTRLESCRVQGANLRGADLRNLYLLWDGGNFAGADLRAANLEAAQFPDANFRGADLRGANLEGAFLCGADFRGAKLSTVRMHGAYYNEATRVPRGFSLKKHGALFWDD
jgi:hypothetical protein